MSESKSVRDLMVDVFEFPHISHWASIKQAIDVVKKTVIESEKCIRPIVVLVFDEKYNLVGTLTHINLLKGLEPRFLQATTRAQGIEGDTTSLSVIWDSLFSTESQKLAEKPVREIMVPVNFFLEPDDSITKGAYLMLHHDLILLPVLENKKKLVGVLRMIEVFDELSNIILKNKRGASK